MKCPVCQTPDLLISVREGVEIDYCPQCRGVWLDRGELDKIIERTLPERDDDDRPFERDYDRREREQRGDWDRDKAYPRKKKRSFLGDLFEFD